MKKHCKILIIEPSAIIREGLARIANQISCVDKIIQVETWEHVVIKDDRIDMVIINTHSCNKHGRLLSQVVERFKDTTLLGLITTIYDRKTGFDYHDVIYLNDSANDIQSVVVKHLTRKQEDVPVHQLLTGREIDVLKQYAAGKSVKEIADVLNISSHTVVSHRKNITAKLGIKTTSAMAIYAVTTKLIDAADILTDIPHNRE